jgi:hypothetical protein
VTAVAVAVYPEIADPPLSIGGIHDTVNVPSPVFTVTPDGEVAFVYGVTASEGELAEDAPARLLATTVKV